MSKTVEILQCPFCGSLAEELQWPEGGSMDRFGCSNHVGDCILCGIEATLDEWNKRAAPVAERFLAPNDESPCRPHNLIRCDQCAWIEAEKVMLHRNAKPRNLGMPQLSNGLINTSDPRMMVAPAADRQVDTSTIPCTHPEGCASCSWCGLKAATVAPVLPIRQPEQDCDYTKGWNACPDQAK